MPFKNNATLYGTVALPLWQYFMTNANLLICLLRLTAIITEYISNADIKAIVQEINWRRFIAGKGCNDGRTKIENTRWAQWVLAEMGCVESLVQLAGSMHWQVRLSNIKFGTELLAGGCHTLSPLFLTLPYSSLLGTIFSCATCCLPEIYSLALSRTFTAHLFDY